MQLKKEHYKLLFEREILLRKRCVAQPKCTPSSLQLRGERTDPGWIWAPLPTALEKKKKSVGQGRWGTHVGVTNSVLNGWVWVFGSWGNRGTELRDVQVQTWCYPGPEFLPCGLVFQALLWGCSEECFPSQLAQPQETLFPERSWNHPAGRFL